MFDATRLALLAQTACHMRYLRNHYLSLLCSPCLGLSILCSDILSTCATRHVLVQPYQAPRQDSEKQWGDKAESIDPGCRHAEGGERDVGGQTCRICYQTSNRRPKGDPQRLESWDGRRRQNTFPRTCCRDAPATDVREAETDASSHQCHAHTQEG